MKSLPHLTGVAVLLLLLGVLPLSSPAQTVDTDEVKRVLADQGWAEVASEVHVKHGRERWGGPKDLSFRYRVAVRDGDLWLWVVVTDDKPGLRGEGRDWLASDHVELWLADPALVEDYEKQRKGVAEIVREFEERQKDGYCSEPEASFLGRQRAILAKLKSDRFFTQLVIGESVWRVPGDDSAFPRGLAAQLRTEHSYEVFARVPLYGACDFKRQNVTWLGLLVDVVDVDEARATGQKTLMSSNPDRLFAEPSRFQVLPLDPPYHLPLGPCDELRGQVSENGFWKQKGNVYERVTWAEQPWSGCLGTDRDIYAAGPWQPAMAGNPVPPDYSMTITPLGSKLLLAQPGNCALLDLKDRIHAEGGISITPVLKAVEGDSTYLVLEASGDSRWPGGSTGCGAGTESDLIWIKLDSALNVQALDSVHFESCWAQIEVQSHLMGTRRMEVRFAQHMEGADEITRVILDLTKPQEGFFRQKVDR